MEIFSAPIQHSTTKVPSLFAVYHHSHLIFRLLRKTHLQTTKQPFIPPLLNRLANQTVRRNSKQIPIWSFPGNHYFWPRNEIQTDTLPFEHNFHLQTTNKCSIKLPPITILNFNGNPLKYHEWIKKFLSLSTIISVLQIHTV